MQMYEIPVDEHLRSLESNKKVYLRMANVTPRTVELVWITYSGSRKRYKLLHPYSCVNVDTYKTHPWIVRDVRTKDRMRLNQSYTLLPEPCEHRIPDPERIHPIVTAQERQNVLITLPVYSLKYRCLLAIRDRFVNAEGVLRLDLPRSLLDDLTKVITARNRELLVCGSELTN